MYGDHRVLHVLAHSFPTRRSSELYIDGDQGVLLHRGYPIEQLADKTDYLETCYLLLNGELPTAEEKAKFISTIKNHTMVHEQLKSFLNGFRSEEPTSELQSLMRISYAVFCLKKKPTKQQPQ